MNIAFILGVARSGTSILGELLAVHPKTFYIFEAHSVWELGGMGQNESHRLAEVDATPELMVKIRAWFKYKSIPDRLILEKSPRNTLRVPYVHSIFPEGRFIHIIRDGRDVACSLVPGCGGDKWLHLKPPSWQKLFVQYQGAVRCALVWQESIRIALDDLAQVNHLQVKYEDLVQTPREVAEKMLSFLGLDNNPAVYDFCEKIQDATTAPHHARVQNQWFRADHKVRIGRYRENLSDGELRTINQLVGPTLQKLGYDL